MLKKIEEPFKTSWRIFCDAFSKTRGITTKHRISTQVAYWDTIPIEIYISVPAMWNDYARGAVRNAAKVAGAWRTELREEPLCVATVYMLELVRGGTIKEGQCILLIDCGEGTLDVATVKMVRLPEGDQLMVLERVGLCSGNAAGSYMINGAAFKWLLDDGPDGCPEVQVRGFAETCRRLGMSERQFMRKFSEGIDSVKEQMDTQTHPLSTYRVRIESGHHGVAPNHDYELAIALPRHLVMSWYAAWTDLAVSLVEDHLSIQNNANYVCASLTGGGSKSDEFQKQVSNLLSRPQCNIPFGAPTPCISACSRGALQQHLFQEDTLPPTAYWYITQDEEFTKTKHPDAAADRTLVEKSEYNPTLDIVRDRLVRIMKSSKRQGFESEGYLPTEFRIETGTNVDLPRVHVDLYWKERPVRAHSALRDTSGELREGIRGFPLVFVDLDDFSAHGFEVQDAGGKPHFFVPGFVQMQGCSESLQITIYLMKQGYEHPDSCFESARSQKKLDEIPQPFEDDKVLKEHTQEVWHRYSSHFVSSSSGTAGLAAVPKAIKRKAPGPLIPGERKSARLSGVAMKSDDSDSDN